MIGLLSLLLAAPADVPDTVVVCPKEFVTALAPWIQYREAQGHRIEIVGNRKSAAELKSSIREVAARGGLKTVVLVGDVDPRAVESSDGSRPTIASNIVPAKVNVFWGSEPEIATDNQFADLNGDEIPDVAIGRLPVDTPEQLKTLITKIIDYEKNDDFGAWRRRVSFVAGVGGFGELADSILETATKKFLTEGIPPTFQTSMAYGSWRSAYCPDPRRFHDAAIDRFNEGCLFWVYIGHGQRHYLDRVHVPGSAYHILNVDDVPKLDHGGRPPIAVFLACYTGAFDSSRDCLAEEMVKSPCGPIAVFSGSRVTMPYAMSVMGTELMHNVFATNMPTLGEVILVAKQQMVAEPAAGTRGAENRPLLDSLAKAISPKPELLHEERREHLSLFNLLGDPLLRIARPQSILVEVPERIHASERVAVKIKSPLRGSCTIDLALRRDRLKSPAPVREYYDGRDRVLKEYHAMYLAANDPVLTQQTVAIERGETTIELTIPDDARGQCHIRAFTEGIDQFALGGANVFVRKPKEE